MFDTPGFAIVFLRHTLGICAVAGDVMVGNSSEIGAPGKATAPCSSVRSSIMTLSLLGCCSSFWSGRSCYNRYLIMHSMLDVVLVFF